MEVENYGQNGGRFRVWSDRLQWLPCDISFSDGQNARIDSYVNNLHHGEHKGLYEVLQELITRVVPLWNITTQFHYGLEVPQGNRARTSEITFVEASGPDDSGTFGDNEVTPRVVQPEPDEYEGLVYAKEKIENKFAFLRGKEKKLQVIIKLANIHLTPEKPKYSGCTWHVEGALNERIGKVAETMLENEN